MTDAAANNKKIFISYSSKDRDFVAKVKNQLNQLSFITWFDRDVIVGGEVWSAQITEGLESCIGLLLFVSPNSAGSEWVKKEYSTVRQQNKPVVPILIKATESEWFESIRSELHYVDFQDANDDVKFIRAIYELVNAICERVKPANCHIVLNKTREMIGSETIRAYLDEVEKNRLAAHIGIDEIRKSCGNTLQRWTQPQATPTADKLVRFAMGEDIPNPQIMLAAAETIGYCGNSQAVSDLANLAKSQDKAPKAFNALKTIWETRPNGIPNAYLGDLNWRIWLYIIRRQLTTPPAWRQLLLAVVGASLAIMFAINIEFHDPQDTFPLTRWSNNVSIGIAYGLFVGLGIVLAYLFIPRLKIFRQVRFILAFIAGWAIVSATFAVLMNLFYRKVPADWSPVIGLSALFVLGYAVSGIFGANRLLKTLLRMGIAFAGVFAAFSIPCGWSVLPVRLLYFSNDCTLKAFVASILIIFISFLLELWGHIAERGNVSGFFLRLRKLAVRA